ncbi:MAG TPA: hypothetical protein PLK99_11655 [Burkholderiales bacterium]|nr:hypothetical protein [Burkholderiales bacterium]
MLPKQNAYRDGLLQALVGMREELRENRVPPAVVDVASGKVTGIADRLFGSAFALPVGDGGGKASDDSGVPHGRKQGEFAPGIESDIL